MGFEQKPKYGVLLGLVIIALVTVSVGAVILLWTSPNLTATTTLTATSTWNSNTEIPVSTPYLFNITISNANIGDVTTNVQLNWGVSSNTNAVVTVDSVAYTMGANIPITVLAGGDITLECSITPNEIAVYSITLTQ